MSVSLRSVLSHSTSEPGPVYSSSGSPPAETIVMYSLWSPLLMVRFPSVYSRSSHPTGSSAPMSIRAETAKNNAEIARRADTVRYVLRETPAGTVPSQLHPEVTLDCSDSLCSGSVSRADELIQGQMISH